jgi:chemotaxis protein methyltransferase CheR
MTRPAPADDAAFPALARKISAGVGLALDAYKEKCIRRRIAVRMRACGAQTYADYGALLDRSPGELERLKDALTINVTRFYRNAETWNLLRRAVVPALAEREPGELRVWSAGCASGEEAYTAAMLFADHFDELGRPERLVRLTVDATDIDRVSLERASAGLYRPEALAELPAPYIDRYFEHAGADAGAGYAVAPRLRRQVCVRSHDLSRAAAPRAGYHLILCRNVVIYFDRPTQEQLLLRFADALAPGGYLVLGKVETLLGVARGRLSLVDARERLFQRPSASVDG